jgi:hypothetical protein
VLRIDARSTIPEGATACWRTSPRLRHTPEGGALFEGTWFDRTQEFAARNRGESFGLRKYAMPEVLELDPLPCWRHLSEKQYQSRMAGLVEKITVEAAARRKETGSQPLGPAAILAQHPFGQPVKTKRSFAPRVHAFSREIRKTMVEAYAWFVAAFREAAEKLRSGDRMARFPEGSFPPGLPFVRGCLQAAVP